MTPTIQLYGFPFTSFDVSNSSLKFIVPWLVWRAMRISNWRISYSMKLSASKWTHFLSHLCVNTWYFLKQFVFCHFHYKYDYTNRILCHNSCSTSFHSLAKKPLYIYLGIFFCECIIDLSRWFWVNLLFFAKCFWVYIDKIFCIELYFLFCIINWKMYLGIKWCDTL